MSIYGLLHEAYEVPHVVQAAVLAIVLLMAGSLVVRRQLAVAGGGVVPDEGVSLRNTVEVLVDALVGMARDLMGDDWRRYFPVVGSIFVFVFLSNLLGLVPGVGGATSDVNTTTAWAIISFLVYNYIGIKTHGWKYIYQFMGPVLWHAKIGGKEYHVRVLAPFMLLLEIPLHLARVATLSIRLLANMFADHTVVTVWLGLVPPLVPAIFMGLGLVIAFLQAFVFALLTMIYIGLALDEPH